MSFTGSFISLDYLKVLTPQTEVLVADRIYLVSVRHLQVTSSQAGLVGNGHCYPYLVLPLGNVTLLRGKGHKIAFNILNIGRFKLGVGVLGGGKRTLKIAVDYAQERKQFGQPIGDFGAIRAKIGTMATIPFTRQLPNCPI